MNIDFTNLPLVALVSTLLFFAAIDTVVTVALAVIAGNFQPSYLLTFLQTHILKVATPILGLGLIGHGIPALGVPPIPEAGLAASVALAAYAVSTIASLRGSFLDKGVVPVAGVVTPK